MQAAQGGRGAHRGPAWWAGGLRIVVDSGEAKLKKSVFGVWRRQRERRNDLVLPLAWRVARQRVMRRLSEHVGRILHASALHEQSAFGDAMHGAESEDAASGGAL